MMANWIISFIMSFSPSAINLDNLKILSHLDLQQSSGFSSLCDPGKVT